MNSQDQNWSKKPSGGELVCCTGYTETANHPESEESPATGGPSTVSQGGARLRRSKKHLDAAKALLYSSGPIPLLTMMSIEDVKAAYTLFKLNRSPQGAICKKNGNLKGRSSFCCSFCKKKFHSKESLTHHHLKRYLRLQAPHKVAHSL